MWCCLLAGYPSFDVAVGRHGSVVGSKVAVGDVGCASCVRIEEGGGL